MEQEKRQGSNFTGQFNLEVLSHLVASCPEVIIKMGDTEVPYLIDTGPMVCSSSSRHHLLYYSVGATSVALGPCCTSGLLSPVGVMSLPPGVREVGSLMTVQVQSSRFKNLFSQLICPTYLKKSKTLLVAQTWVSFSITWGISRMHKFNWTWDSTTGWCPCVHATGKFLHLTEAQSLINELL